MNKIIKEFKQNIEEKFKHIDEEITLVKTRKTIKAVVLSSMMTGTLIVLQNSEPESVFIAIQLDKYVDKVRETLK